MTISEAETKKPTSKKLKKKALATSNVDIPSPASAFVKSSGQNGVDKEPAQVPFRNVGGGSIGKHPVLFSADSTYVFLS